MVTFKGSKSEEERLTESTKIIGKYPDKIPVIVEKYTKSSIKNIDKNKYLVSGDMTMSQFIYIIRKHERAPTASGPLRRLPLPFARRNRNIGNALACHRGKRVARTRTVRHSLRPSRPPFSRDFPALFLRDFLPFSRPFSPGSQRRCSHPASLRTPPCPGPCRTARPAGLSGPARPPTARTARPARRAPRGSARRARWSCCTAASRRRCPCASTRRRAASAPRCGWPRAVGSSPARTRCCIRSPTGSPSPGPGGAGAVRPRPVHKASSRRAGAARKHRSRLVTAASRPADLFKARPTSSARPLSAGLLRTVPPRSCFLCACSRLETSGSGSYLMDIQ